MAKKVVASLQTNVQKNYSKVIRIVKSEKTGAYVFKEEIIHADKLKDLLEKK